jgi:hypothetical protein
VRAKVGLAVCLLMIGGCATTTDGHPTASPGAPTEPSFPTARPSRTPPTTTTTTPPPTTAAPGAATLPPDDSGYVFIETKSGKTRCQVSKAEVGCESQFANAPVVDGFPANGVNVTADGAMRWITGNLGDIPVVTLDYRTYRAVGWTIAAGSDGTRFTNDRTGHGMFISTDGVQVF